MAAINHPIDPEQSNHFPIILSDALLGKGQKKEVFTSVRYNFQPSPKSETSRGDSIVKPSESSPDSYDLNTTENKEEYAYRGTRQAGDSEYVLIFNPEKRVFVLHQVDSTFNMNVTSTPWDDDPDSLRSTYTQIPATTNPPATKGADTKRKKAEPKPKAQTKAQVKAQSKVAAKAPQKSQTKAQPKAKPKRELTPEEEESDDGLTIEYPDGPPRKSGSAFRSEPVKQKVESEDEGSDVDEEERNKDVDVMRLPSPAGGNDDLNGEEDGEGDLDLDLEAELEQALEVGFEEVGMEQVGDDDSSESEEED